ncbi:thiamine pyrophosphate-dependent dehydrogenase E1 component subunit alpha [Azospirillum rugosum]|uniref:Pyruvate dehydrogenase E1 component alpha subunit n=1 Tax=Azospirillum rugosum TaxID=416170 RepID=A0ABS4SP36_9PROT|nr:thiamine pyrophosphate-dependent dehydrogenase E1 component subunit alpha [Azospirillum rugosum]MBP2294318.1 pyruvate dehydrogenase E1 component alpha subunit [Azospirillum rugosum]MDQ0527653.1 pyruvate dehydrogenase E1 component alpha subunit [Azospirillum rugosum]
MHSPTIETRRRLYQSVLRLRRTEERLAALYRDQEMRTPTHFGVGQEAVAAGVCEALDAQDVVYSHHRCHNHYLARGGSVFALAAELYGRDEGCSRGRGGSVHLTGPDHGFMISSAILGQTIAVATGSALAFKMDGVPRVAVAFFGDAACEEGIFYESLNYAATHGLPVLLVCENNLYSTESPLQVRQPSGTQLCERAAAFKLRAEQVDGNDVFAVHQAASRLLDGVRQGRGPAFLECMTYRWLEHVGPCFDHEMNRSYRSREELEAWMERCPLRRAGDALLAQGAATRDELEAWRVDVDHEVEEAVARAKAGSWPEPESLFDNVY